MGRCSVRMKVVYVCSLIALSFKPYDSQIITYQETRKNRIGLNEKDSLTESGKTPNCGSEKKIYLVAYSYHRLQCHLVNGCISTHEESLLPAEEFLLHQMCSMQERCKNLTFPLRSETQRSRTNAVVIEFQCIDLNKMPNICGKHEMHFNDAVYLTSVDIKGSFTECQCFVTNGRFAITHTDIRLNDKARKKCSSARLDINNRQFSCDANRDDYGSVFHDEFGELFSNAFISLTQNSRTDLPDMVLLTLIPESSAKLTCSGKQAMTIGIPNITTATLRNTDISKLPSTTTLATTTSADNTEQETNGSLTTLEICLIAIVVVLSLGCCLFCTVVFREKLKGLCQSLRKTSGKQVMDDIVLEQLSDIAMRPVRECHTEENTPFNTLHPLSRHTERTDADLLSHYKGKC